MRAQHAASFMRGCGSCPSVISPSVESVGLSSAPPPPLPLSPPRVCSCSALPATVTVAPCSFLGLRRLDCSARIGSRMASAAAPVDLDADLANRSPSGWPLQSVPPPLEVTMAGRRYTIKQGQTHEGLHVLLWPARADSTMRN